MRAGIDLDGQRRARIVERPDREASAAQPSQHRPAADRARAHAAVAANLERRLRAHPSVRRDRRLGDPQVRGELGSRPAGPSPERRVALREPVVAVARGCGPQLVDRRRTRALRRTTPGARTRSRSPPRARGRPQRARARDRLPGHGCGRPRVERARRRLPRPARSRAVRRSCFPTSRPRRRARG